METKSATDMDNEHANPSAWFLCGKQHEDRMYGRVVGEKGSRDETFVSIPKSALESIAESDTVLPGDCLPITNHREGEPSLPGAKTVDWRELAVNMHVKTPLTKREADTYVLRHRFNMGREEIATQLDISPNTVDNHLRRVNGIDSEMIQLVVNTIQIFGLSSEVAESLTELSVTKSQ